MPGENNFFFQFKYHREAPESAREICLAAVDS